MEVRTVSTLRSSKSPISGAALYVVVSETTDSVRLLYPFTMEEFTMGREEIRDSMGRVVHDGYEQCKGEPYASPLRIAKVIRDRVALDVHFKRPINTGLAVKVLAELEGRPFKDVEGEIVDLVGFTPDRPQTASQQKMSTKYRIHKGSECPVSRGRGVIVWEALKKIGETTVTELFETLRGKVKGENPERFVNHIVKLWCRLGLLETA